MVRGDLELQIVRSRVADRGNGLLGGAREGQRVLGQRGRLLGHLMLGLQLLRPVVVADVADISDVAYVAHVADRAGPGGRAAAVP